MEDLEKYIKRNRLIFEARSLDVSRVINVLEHAMERLSHVSDQELARLKNHISSVQNKISKEEEARYITLP